MKVNRNTVITLSIISIILISLIIIPEILDIGINARFESITLNILCGCIVSIVMCIVNYTIEKKRIEEMIFQKLISNYNFLSILNSPLLVDIDGNELYDSKYNIYIPNFLKTFTKEIGIFNSKTKTMIPILTTIKQNFIKRLLYFQMATT